MELNNEAFEGVAKLNTISEHIGLMRSILLVVHKCMRIF